MCGHGPSGRNGGFCETLWSNLPDLVERFGPEPRAGRGRGVLGERGDDRRLVRGAGRRRLVQAQGVPARLHRRAAGRRDRPRARAPARRPGKVVALDGAALRARCDSPRFRRGLLRARRRDGPPGAARARAARPGDRARRAGVRALAGHARLRGTVAETAHGRVRAGAAVLAVNAAARGVKPAAAPARGHLLAHRAHRAGAATRSRRSAGPAARASPTRGPSCTTSAPRTTTGSCSAGAAAGWRRARGSAGASRSTRRSPRRPAGTCYEICPPPRARAITHAWGGPIDVSPSHLPQVGTLDGRAGPLRVRLHRQRRRPVPPRRAHPRRAGRGGDPRGRAARRPTPCRSRPSRSPGPAGCSSAPRSCAGSGIESQGRRADPLTRAICAAPRALGIHVCR